MFWMEILPNAFYKPNIARQSLWSWDDTKTFQQSCPYASTFLYLEVSRLENSSFKNKNRE